MLQSISNLFDAAQEETAATLPLPSSDDSDSLVESLQEQLLRANMILDRNKDAVMFQVLDIQTKDQMQKAMDGYSRGYLLGLALSMESVQDVVRELLALTKTFKMQAPKAWIDIANGNFRIESMVTELDDDLPEERRRAPI